MKKSIVVALIAIGLAVKGGVRPLVKIIKWTVGTVLRSKASLTTGTALVLSAAGGAFAQVDGYQTTAGQATIRYHGNNATITSTTRRAAGTASSVTIQANERLTINQPNVDAHFLLKSTNTRPDHILGQLLSNGKVTLSALNGLYIRPGARIDVNALTASGLDVSTDAFMAGRHRYNGVAGSAGVVVNQGVIKAATGGSVNLVGKAVQNEGVILARAGQVNLVAGNKVAMDFDGDGLMRFAVDEGVMENDQALAAAVKNSGEIIAEGGSVLLQGKTARSVFDQVVNNEGLVRAGRIENQGGKIRLVAAGPTSSVINTGTLDTTGIGGDGGEITLESEGTITTTAASRITASTSAADGSLVTVENDRARVTEIRAGAGAQGESAGGLIDADHLSISTTAAVSAEASGGDLTVTAVTSPPVQINTGGTVRIQAEQIRQAGEIQVSGSTGGAARLEALDSLDISGQIIAQGEQAEGGDIRLLGEVVDLRGGTRVDVAGAGDGGEIRVGGGWQGGETEVRNARHTTVADNVRLRADGGVVGSPALLAEEGQGGNEPSQIGDGGTVVVWADDTTRFAGAIRARGGNRGGAGGRAEVSGRKHLYMRGTADLRALRGETGTLLLDPGQVDLCHAGDAGCDVGDDTDGPDRFSDTQLATMLGMANVDVKTSAATTPLGDPIVEDIIVASGFDLNWSSNTLTLEAGNDIKLNGSFTGTSSAKLALRFGGVLEFGGVSLSVVDGITVTGMGMDTQTITGPTAGSTWNITASGTGTLTVGTQSVAFSGVEDLTGGSMVDTFTVSGAHTGDLAGGGGADIFNLNAALTGMASGDGGDDTFTLGASGSATSLDGSADTDTLRGRNAVATWEIDGSNRYLIGSTLAQSFSNIEDLTGGSMADTFTVSGAHTGDLAGGGGADKFTLTAALTGNLAGGAGDDEFNLNASGSVSGTIQGEGDADTFNVNAAYTDTLEGGAGADIFNLNAALTGTAQGDGGDDVFVLGTGGSATTLAGGADTDTLRGRNAIASWTISNTGVLTYQVGGTPVTLPTLTFVETLQGGSMADTFTVSGDYTSNLAGGGGADTFTVSADLTGSLAGEAGADIFNLNDGGSVSADIAGGGDGDTFNLRGSFTANLDGGAGNDMFDINTAMSTHSLTGTVGGGADDDTFTFTQGNTGALDGGGGSDTLDYSAQLAMFGVTLSSADMDGFDLSTTFLASNASSLSNINRVTGTNDTNNSITGLAAAATWEITAGNADYTYTTGTSPNQRTFAFSDNFSTLNGGNMVDTFTVNGMHSGTLSGGTGADILSFSALTTALSVTLSGTPDADGFGGSVSGGAMVTFTDIFDIRGSGTATDDSLTGLNAASSWTVGSSDSYASNSRTLNFSNIEDLTGDSMADTFTVSGAHTGDLSGGGGADEFTLTAALTGSLSGGGGADTFNLNTGGSVSMGISGGAAADTFDFNGGSVTGTVAGNAGADVLDFAGVATALSVTLSGTPDANGFDGRTSGGVTISSFTDIQELIGGSGTDSFTGLNAAATWGIDGSNTYVSSSRTLDFSNLEDLTGGSGADTFTVSAAHTGDLSGGGGADEFTLTAALTGSLSGGGGADTFNLNSGGSVSMGISGGAAADTFDFNGGSVTGTVAGNAGADVLDFAGVATALSVTLSGTPDANGFDGRTSGGVTISSFTDIQELIGGSGTDSFTGLNAAATWGIDGSNTYVSSSRTLDFSNLEDLTGGSGADTFTVSAAHTGDLSGGGGADEFTLTAALTGSLSGGGGADTFNLNTSGSVSMGISGGAAADTFDFNGGSVTGTLAGGGGADVLDFAGVATALSVTLSGTPDADGFGGSVSGGASISSFTGISTIHASTMAATDRVVGLGMDGSFMGDSMMRPTSYSFMVGLIEYDLTLENFESSVSSSMAILDLSAQTMNLQVVLTGADVGGYSGTWTPMGGTATSFADIETITGGMGNDQLTGRGVAASWDFSASDSSYSSADSSNVMRILGFSSFEVLVGGSMVDTFTVAANLSATLRGGGGNDQFNIGATATLTGMVMGGAGTDTLAANRTAYMVTGSNSGTVGGISAGWSEIESLTGTTSADTFTFSASASLSGTLDGLGGSDTLTYAARTNAVSLTLTGLGANGFAGNAGSVTGGFTNIDTLVGGSGTDTLTGLNADATWTVGSSDSYASDDAGDVSRSLGFSNIEDLTGGSMADTFTVSGAHTGDLSGGGGADEFTLTAALTGNLAGGAGDDEFNLNASGSVSGTIQGGNDADTFNVNAAYTDTLEGGAGADIFNLNAALTGSASGGTGDDIFALGAGGSATTLAGGADTDTLRGRNAIASWTISNTGVLTYQVGGTPVLPTLTSVETLQGGSMADTFTVSGDYTSNLAGGGGADTFTVSAALTGSLAGEAGADIFNLNDGGSVSAGIAGGGDGDTFNLRGSFRANLDGGAGNDMFDINTAMLTHSLTGTVGGGADDDTFTFTQGNTGALDGGGGSDTLDYSAQLAMFGVTLSSAGADGFDLSTTFLASNASSLSNISEVIGTNNTNNSIIGLAAAATWEITAGNADYTYTTGTSLNQRTFTFSDDFATLNGGNMVDTFNIAGAHVGSLIAHDGADVFNLDTGGSVTIGLLGGGGVDTFNFRGGSVGSRGVDGGPGADILSFSTLATAVSATLSGTPDADGFGGSTTGGASVTFTDIFDIRGGTATDDSLTGLDADATWTVGSSDSYASDDAGDVSRSLSFSNIEDLTGGSMVDTFTVSGAHSGDLSGGAGADILSFSTLATAVSVTLSGTPDADGFGGSTTGGASVTFTDIFDIRGSTATDDSLTGLDADATWTVGSSDSYASDDAGDVSRSLSFSNIEDLTGGSMADTFTVSGAHSGDLSGGAGTDVLDFSALATAVSVTLSGTPDADGFGGSTTGGASVTFADIFDIRGGTATDDSLTGLNAAATWNLDTAESYTSNSRTLSFSNIESLTGGTGADVFDFSGSFAFDRSVDGGTGSDTLDYADTNVATFTLTSTGTSDGFAGSSSYTRRILGTPTTITTSFNNINEVVGSGFLPDSLTGLDADATWTVGTTSSYVSTNTLTFSAIEYLRGGSMADTFTINVSYQGALWGNGGADTFNLNQALTGGGGDLGNVFGGAGDDLLALGSASASLQGSFDGGADIDTLRGRNAIASWTISSTGVLTYQVGGTPVTLPTLTFVETLQGGSMVDTFTVSGDYTSNLAGGGGADTFTVSAALTGSLAGEAGADIFNLNDGGSVSADIAGGGDGDTFNLRGSFTANLDGGAGNDMFDINTTMSTHSLTGTVGGGADDDTFTFTRGNTGALDGGGGSDTLDYSAQTSSFGVTLSSADMDGFDLSTTFLASNASSLSNISEIIGTNNTNNSIIGLAAAATWEITAGNADYTYTTGTPPNQRTFTFSDDFSTLNGGNMADTFNIAGAHVGSLNGGSGADVFNLNTNGSVSVDISGEAGADTFNFRGGSVGSRGVGGGTGADILSFSALTTAVSVTLSGTPDADGFGGSTTGGASVTFTDIFDIRGGTATDDSLTGLNADAAWTVGSSDSYASDDAGDVSRSLSFSNIEDLTGGSMVDTFTVSGAHSGDLSGGGGADEFTLTAALTGNLAGGAGDDEFNLNTSGSVSGTIQGEGDADTFNVNAAYTDTLEGGAGADIFNLNAILTGTASGNAGDDLFVLGTSGSATSLDGGADTDTLQGRNAAATWEIDGSNRYLIGSILTQSFSNIEDLTGGSMADTFTVTAAHTGNLSGSGGADEFTLTAALTGNLAGGAGDDEFNLNTSGSVSGTIQGEGDADTFNVNAVYSNTLEGGAGDDLFVLGTSGSATSLDGGADTDTLQGRNAAATWEIDGSNRYLIGSTLAQSFSNLEDLTGGSSADTFTVTAAHTGDLSGSGGADEFTLTAALTGSLSGGGGADTFNLNTGGSVSLGISGGGAADTFDFNGGSVTGTVAGNAGADVLDFATLTAAVSINLSGTPDADGFGGSVSGGAGISSFTGISTINASTMAATDRVVGLGMDGSFMEDAMMRPTSYRFVFGAMNYDLTLANFESSVSSRMAILDLSAQTMNLQVVLTGADVGGYSGTWTPMGGTVTSFTDIEIITGGMGNDQLTGRGVAASWDFSASGGSYSSADSSSVMRILDFSSFEVLVGGSMADTFTVNAAYSGSLSGSGGADRFNLNAILTGTASGDAGNDLFVLGTSGSATLLDGGADTDTVQGRNAAATWTVAAGNDTYTIAGTLTQSMSNMENFTGGSMVDAFMVSGAHTGSLAGGGGADTFILGSSGSVTGTLAGGSGADVLDFAGVATALSVTLTGSPDANGFDGSTSGGVTISSFTDIQELIGGSGTDSFTGLNAAATWGIDGSNTYVSSSRTLDFSNLEDLTGGSMADTFTVSGAHTGNLAGGGGADEFTLTAALTGSLSGGSGADTFNLNTGGSVSAGISGGGDADTFDFNGGSVTGTLAGGSGADVLDFAGVATALSVTLTGSPDANGFDGSTSGGVTISSFTDIQELIGGSGTDSFTGLNAAATWGIDGSNTYVSSSRTLDFSNLEDLTGGSGADTFMVSAAHTGDLSGGGGADRFNLNAALTGTASGDVGNDTFILGTNGSATTVTGGGDADTFRGRNAEATWTIGAAGVLSYRVGGTLVTLPILNSIETLQGGSMADTFTVSGMYTGDLSGGGGADVLDFAGLATALSVALSGTPNADGFNGSITGGAMVTFTNIFEIRGSSTATDDSLTGLNAVADWRLGSSDSYMSNSRTLSFSNIEDLTGGSMVDTFTVSGTHSGNLSGGGGADVLDFSTLTAAVSVTLSGTPDTDGFDGGIADGVTVTFTDMFEIRGSSTATDDSLTGLNAAASWTVGSSDSYASNSRTLTFSNIEDLTGGGGADTFTVSGTHTGDLAGGGGADEFTLMAALTGSLAGDAGDDEFNLNTGGSVSVNISGGGDADTFNFNGGGVTGTVAGDGGADVLDFSTLTTVVSAALSGTPGVDGFGGSITGAAMVTFANIFEIRGSATAADNSLTGLDAVADWTIGSSDSYASNSQNLNFSNIESLIGGSMVDTFNVTSSSDANLSGGNGADVFNFNAGTLTASNTVVGGAGADVFNFNGGELNGRIDGSSGSDSLDYADVTSDLVVTLSGIGSIDGFAGSGNAVSGGFDNIDILVGGSGDDRLTGLDADATWTVDTTTSYTSTNTLVLSGVENLIGGGMTDTFNVASSSDVNLGGAGGSNVFNFNAGTLSGDIGSDGFDDFNFAGGAVSGMVRIDGDARWNFMAGQSLGSAVTGAGKLTVVNRPGDSTSYNVSSGGLALPDLRGFTGHLVIGGRICEQGNAQGGCGSEARTPASMQAAGEEFGLAVSAASLTIESSIETGGDLTILADQFVDLLADINVGNGSGLLTVLVPMQGGRITTTSTSPIPTVITAGGAYFIAGDAFENADRVRLQFGGTGIARVATGQGADTVAFEAGSRAAAGTTMDPVFDAVLQRVTNVTNVNFTESAVSVLNPSADLVGLKELGFIDTGLFEEDLTLFGVVGQGVALALAQCEEIEGCAPDVTDEELVELIDQLESRLVELFRRLGEAEGEGNSSEQAALESLIAGFQDELENFIGYRKKLQEYLTSDEDEEFEEDFELDLAEDEPSELDKLTEILAGIQVRIQWLEALKDLPEERARLTELTGIELTQEALDTIIEGAKSEARFIEQQLRLLQEATEASISPAISGALIAAASALGGVKEDNLAGELHGF